MTRTLICILIFMGFRSTGQISVINTGTTEHILNLSKIGNNILISGNKTYLVKCYQGCNSLIPLTVPTATNSSFAFSITRPDSNTVYMNSYITWAQYTIWKSIDGGLNWSKKVDTFYPDLQLTRFFDTINGVSFCGNFTVASTNNGFNSFSNGSWPNKYPWTIGSFGDSTVAIGDYTGGLSISYDRATSWYACTGMYQRVNDLKFLNRDTLFAITENSTFNYDSCFARSYDKGKTWDCMRFFPNDVLTTPAKYLLIRIHVKSRSEIYALAFDNYTQEGIIFRTSNQGNSWDRYVTPFQIQLNDMCFLNDSMALICGNSGLLFKWNSKTANFVTGLDEKQSSSSIIHIYPSPTKDILCFQISNKSGINYEMVTVTLIDLTGKVVLKKVFEKLGGGVLEMSLGPLERGIYTAKVQGADFSFQTKVIKE